MFCRLFFSCFLHLLLQQHGPRAAHVTGNTHALTLPARRHPPPPPFLSTHTTHASSPLCARRPSLPNLGTQGFHPQLWSALTTTLDGPEVAIFKDACARNKIWGVFSLTGARGGGGCAAGRSERRVFWASGVAAACRNSGRLLHARARTHSTRAHTHARAPSHAAGEAHPEEGKNPYNTLVMIDDAGAIKLVYRYALARVCARACCPFDCWGPRRRCQARRRPRRPPSSHARPCPLHYSPPSKIYPWVPKEPWTAGHETAVAVGPKGICIGASICYDMVGALPERRRRRSGAQQRRPSTSVSGGVRLVGGCARGGGA